jgi:ParB family transcriptional regulator, chromosome partitioning protein
MMPHAFPRQQMPCALPFRDLPDETRAAWLGMVVARTLEASLNIGPAFGQRGCAFHDLLGSLLGIDVAAWWRPTAANFFDRVSKATILDALSQVGGIQFW